MSEENKTEEKNSIIERNINAHIDMTGDSWDESFLYLVKEYACCPDEDLGKEALRLKKALVGIVDQAFCVIHEATIIPKPNK